jgi:hypothetical protein
MRSADPQWVKLGVHVTLARETVVFERCSEAACPVKANN